MTLAATLWISRLAEHATERALSLRGHADAGTISVVGRLVQYVVIIAGFAVALQTSGIDLGVLFAAGAFFAVALGFAMQNIAQNFVSGVILLTERTIKPGDVLEVQGRVVRVSRIGLRATVARSREDEDLIIPNGALAQNIVTNYTLRDPIYRLKAPVGVAYESDLELVTRVLRETGESLPWRDTNRDVLVLLTGFGDSAVTFEVSVWIHDPWRARVRLSELLEAIWWALKRNDIRIPFPQRDVHLIDQSRRVAASTDRAP